MLCCSLHMLIFSSFQHCLFLQSPALPSICHFYYGETGDKTCQSRNKDVTHFFICSFFFSFGIFIWMNTLSLLPLPLGLYGSFFFLLSCLSAVLFFAFPCSYSTSHASTMLSHTHYRHHTRNHRSQRLIYH